MTKPIRRLDIEQRKKDGMAEYEYRRRSCGTKIRFLSELEALRAMSRLPDPDYMHAYNCPFCEFWHIGHRVGLRKISMAITELDTRAVTKLNGARQAYRGIKKRLSHNDISPERRAELEKHLRGLVEKYTWGALESDAVLEFFVKDND